MTAPVLDTAAWQLVYGRAPRGRGTWTFTVAPDIPLAECHRHGPEAHHAHMAANGECPWCGAARLVYTGTWSAAMRWFAKLGPGPWVLDPGSGDPR